MDFPMIEESDRSIFAETPGQFPGYSYEPIVPQGRFQENSMELREISEIPEQYRDIFPFANFNTVQSLVLDDVLYTDRPLVLCAPTGSGKTVAFELAIVRLLVQQNGTISPNYKTVYMAPMKSICREKFEDWKSKFEPVGLNCVELTGDTDIDDYYELQEANIILTTPEKWDSMTRRWRDNKSLVQMVRLFLIDEVHTLGDNIRGATMEAVVSRMKTVQLALSRDRMHDKVHTLRFVAVSATIPNVQDVADWLTVGPCEAACYSIDESQRPVRLRKVVLGFPCSESTSGFRFDLSLNYKLANVIETYSERKPTLVFCATRKGSAQTASILIKDARFILRGEHKQQLQQAGNTLRDSKLRECVLSGVGYHHAGLDVQDRKTVEMLFGQGILPVLICTSTLAMGVNLPAHLVVVKSTQHYISGVYQEYTETQMLQMIGRAGRPQFDKTATAVIMTRTSTKMRYESLLNGTQVIESTLHLNLAEHLNAEIVLSTINDVSIALEWIQSTFLYIRIMKNPKHYGIAQGLSTDKVDQKLQELCLKNLNALAMYKLVQMDEDCFVLQPTESGKAMARYCIAFETMKNFHNICGTETLPEILDIFCSSQEFADIQLRVNEKKILNTLNKDKNKLTIRFPMEGKIKTTEMKINCLIQAQLGCLYVTDFSLQQDLLRIFRASFRVACCLVEVLWGKQNQFLALLNAVLLTKCVKAKLWENSRHITRQLAGIGSTLSSALVDAGICTYQKLQDTNPRDLELIVNRHPPFGNQVKDAVNRLPKYDLCIHQSTAYGSATAEVNINISIVNSDSIREKSTTDKKHACVLLIGDADNQVVHICRISDAQLLRHGPWIKRLEIKRSKKGDELGVHLISQDMVGLDVHTSYTPYFVGPKTVKQEQSAPAVAAIPAQVPPKQYPHSVPAKVTSKQHSHISKKLKFKESGISKYIAPNPVPKASSNTAWDSLHLYEKRCQVTEEWDWDSAVYPLEKTQNEREQFNMGTDSGQLDFQNAGRPVVSTSIASSDISKLDGSFYWPADGMPQKRTIQPESHTPTAVYQKYGQHADDDVIDAFQSTDEVEIGDHWLPDLPTGQAQHSGVPQYQYLQENRPPSKKQKVTAIVTGHPTCRQEPMKTKMSHLTTEPVFAEPFPEDQMQSFDDEMYLTANTKKQKGVYNSHNMFSSVMPRQTRLGDRIEAPLNIKAQRLCEKYDPEERPKTASSPSFVRGHVKKFSFVAPRGNDDRKCSVKPISKGNNIAAPLSILGSNNNPITKSNNKITTPPIPRSNLNAMGKSNNNIATSHAIPRSTNDPMRKNYNMAAPIFQPTSTKDNIAPLPIPRSTYNSISESNSNIAITPLSIPRCNDDPMSTNTIVAPLPVSEESDVPKPSLDSCFGQPTRCQDQDAQDIHENLFIGLF